MMTDELTIETLAMPTHYRIADGRIWDISAARFVAEAPADAVVCELYANGAPGDVAYLRKTLEYYGKTVGMDLMALEEAKAAKLAQIDAETSATILSGFDYEIDGTTYHFSYDSFDQQNFVDTASMCQISLAGTPGLPSSVTWNSYTADGALVQQTFDAASFLVLYRAGAMTHKAARMAEGGARKAKVAAAKSIEEVESA